MTARTRTGLTTAGSKPRSLAPAEEPLSEPNPPTSADVFAARQAPGALERFAHQSRAAFRLSNVIPVVGGLPSASDPRNGPPPFLLGLAGLWD